jgi:hypothetical protein
VAGIAFLTSMTGVSSCILGGLYLLFRDDHPSDEPKKRRKRLLVSNWK